MRTCTLESRDLVRLRSNESIFRSRSLRIHNEIRSRSLRISIEANRLQRSDQNDRVRYLDLAARPCLRNMRRDHVKFDAVHSLPPVISEYLIAESELPTTNPLAIIFTRASRVEQWRLKRRELEREKLGMDFFHTYSWLLLGRIENYDIIRWKRCIRRYLNAYRLFKVNVLPFFDYPIVITRLCTGPEADPALTIQVLRTLCNAADFQKSRAFRLVPSECLETILRQAKVMRFDFWGIWRGVGYLGDKYSPVSDYIFEGRNQLATLLIKYGFPHPPVVSGSSPDVMTPNSSVFRMFQRFVLDHMRYSFVLQLGEIRTRLCMYIFMAFIDLEQTEDVVAKQTFEYLMRSIPEPYIIPHDMYVKLSRFLTNDGFIRMCDISSLYLDYFYEMYPKAGNHHTMVMPRELKHLSRCVIRKAIGDNFRLPEGIHELDETLVPPIIKQYLLLEL